MASRDIKTRKITKDIHVLDRSAVVSERLKKVYIRTKEMSDVKADQSGSSSPEMYAYEKVTDAGTRSAQEGIYLGYSKTKQAIRHSRKNPKETIIEQSVDDVDVIPQEEVEAKQKVHTGEKKEEFETTRIKTAYRYRENKTVSISQKPKGEIRVKERTTSRDKNGIKTASKKIRYLGKDSKLETQIAAKKKADAIQSTLKRQQLRRSIKNIKEAAKATARALKKLAKALYVAVKSLINIVLAGGWMAVLIIIIVVFLGAMVCFFSGPGGTSTAAQSVSQEVLNYEPLISQYANQYGISEYVALLEAVMMQESGGRGTDPMQASECPYNTKYSHAPGSITDPAYSIECGVQTLKACLEAAQVEHPSDMEHIKLALQGYNYGNGYIGWAVKNYGGYTAENAAIFSDTMAAKYGWSRYGDKEYVPHVLQYYSFNCMLGGSYGGSQAIIQIASHEIGYKEGAGNYTKYGAWYGMPNEAWCAMFVSWCADQAGYVNAGVCPKLALCQTIVEWFQSRNQWYSRDTIVPSPGYYILFDRNHDGRSDHVGLVEYVQDGEVHTIEGNSSDMVRQRSYSLSDGTIMGYGAPAY